MAKPSGESGLRRLAGAAFGMALLLVSGLLTSPAQARYVVTLEELRGIVSIDVLARGSGSIDLTGLIFIPEILITSSIIDPAEGVIITGILDFIAVDTYTGFTGPTSFGSGSTTLGRAFSSSGDAVGIDALEFLFVPEDYRFRRPLVERLNIRQPDPSAPSA
jgi:hypothetical protein